LAGLYTSHVKPKLLAFKQRKAALPPTTESPPKAGGAAPKVSATDTLGHANAPI
jgi:hypothetical protein